MKTITLDGRMAIVNFLLLTNLSGISITAGLVLTFCIQDWANDCVLSWHWSAFFLPSSSYVLFFSYSYQSHGAQVLFVFWLYK